jgi:integrase
MNRFEPDIKQGTYPSGSPYWHFNQKLPDGSIHRTKYPTEKEAQRERMRLIREFNAGGSTVKDLTEVEGALLKLQTTDNASANGKSLLFAVNWFCENYFGKEDEKPVADYIAEYKAKRSGLTKRTCMEDHHFLKHFEMCFGERRPSQILAEEIEEYIEINTCQYNRHKILKSFFSWLSNNHRTMKKAFIIPPIRSDLNPFERINSIKQTRKNPIQIVKSNQVIPFLKEAYSLGILPPVVIGLFAGIRPEAEYEQIWKNSTQGWHWFDLESGIILITSEYEKMGKRDREIPIQSNLMEWLKLFRDNPKDFPMLPSNRTRKFTWLKKASLTPEQAADKDILRHSFVSHAQKLYSLDELSLMCANSPDVIKKNYFRLVKKEDTELYFSITPSMVIS